MKVLYIANSRANELEYIPNIISATGDEVVIETGRIDLAYVVSNAIDFIVSDRATYLIKKDVIEFLPRKVVNLHPSVLPWCRGYYPNYWSIKTKTVHGVTLHFVDEGIDTGDIIAQTICSYAADDTLRDSYNRLRALMVGLFAACWPEIRCGKMTGKCQDKTDGSLFYRKDFNGVLDSLPNGWDTKVKDI